MGTYEMLFCSKMNAALVMVSCEVVGTLNHYKMVKKLISSSLALLLLLVLALEIRATWRNFRYLIFAILPLPKRN